jgi:hypothetical protein
VKPLTLLVSARDPAAALHLGAICLQAQTDPRFYVRIVAQHPACAMMRGLGLEVTEVPAIRAHEKRDAAAMELIKWADRILALVRPDIMLCGLSSPSDGGIDEALLARSTVPTFMMQDFWGEQNLFFDTGADVLFSLDEDALALNVKRWGAHSVVTGSPRHACYGTLDSFAQRRQVRHELGVVNEHQLVGFFGQPLQRFAGYRRTLEVFANACRKLATPADVAYRAHPRETRQEIEETQQWFAAAGLRVKVMKECTTEAALAACDVACTVFSNCAYDAAYLNRFSPGPLVVPILMLFDQELLNFYSEIIEISSLPYFSKQLALPVWGETEMLHSLEAALSDDTKAHIWANAGQLPDPSMAIKTVLEALAGTFGQQVK